MKIEQGIRIIIVTYNAMTWLKKCLDSCNSYKVIVVDNASIDDTVSLIEYNYPNVTLIKQSKNLGFGQGNNIGIRYALEEGAKHVFLLNQDAYLVEDALDRLVTYQKAHTEYGVLSPMHITGNQQQLDKNFSNYMLREETGQFYSDFVLGRELASVYNVPFINAAAWLVSKSCLETVGGFDPLFFHYGEDDNYCQRVLYHGHKIGVLPNTIIIHDRENRAQTQPVEYSEAYYKNLEKNYKVRYANILEDNKVGVKLKKLKRIILKLQLKIKFERAAALKKELIMLQNLIPKIKASRERNVLQGAHYLDNSAD